MNVNLNIKENKLYKVVDTYKLFLKYEINKQL